MLELPSPALTRRGVLRAGFAVAALSALGACAQRPASRPGYLKTDLGEPADFELLLHAKTVSGAENIGGVDLHFAEGAPLLAIAPGYVYAVGRSDYGGNVTRIDYGTVVYEYAHQLETFVKPRQRVERGMIIGREGRTGINAGEHSHVHVTVAGSAAFNDHRYRRFGPKYEEHAIAEMMNYVLDPDRLTGGGPLVESPWNPAVNYDAVYTKFVDGVIVPALLRIADGDGIPKSTAGYVKRRARAKALLNQAVNRLWQWRYDDAGPARLFRGTTAQLDLLFLAMRTAGKLIRLTSPYIDPGDDRALAAVAKANPQHVDLLHEYYGSGKLAGTFPRAV